MHQCQSDSAQALVQEVESQEDLGVVEALQLGCWVLNPAPQQDQVPPQDAEPQEPPLYQVLCKEVQELGY